MLKGIKLKLYPNQTQINKLTNMFGSDRFVWNIMLDLINTRYKNNPSLKVLSAYDMNYLLPCLKQEYPFLKESDSSSLQVVTNNLYQAWLMFFKKKHGKPKFHSRKNVRQSYTGQSSTIKLVSTRYMKVPKLGIIKCSNTNLVKGCKIKRYTVSLEPNGNYYLSLQVEFESQEFDKTGAVVGIDLGTHDLAITSDGVKYHKVHTKQLEKKIKYYQSKYSKRLHNVKVKVAFHNHSKYKLYDIDVNNFKNWQKSRLLKAKYQAKLANSRKDYLHKITTQLVKDYDVIVIEDLKTKNLLKNHRLAHSISNQSWRMFRQMLEYKCKFYGKQLVVVSPNNTSRICSNCGEKNHNFDNLTQAQWLGTRNWTCPNCGKEHDRDVNASVNILNRGLKELNIQ